MIRVTQRARAGLVQYLADRQAPAGAGVRLVPLGRRGVDLIVAQPEGGDEVFTREERPLLIVDRRLVERLNGAVFDLAAELRAGEEPDFTVTPG